MTFASTLGTLGISSSAAMLGVVALVIALLARLARVREAKPASAADLPMDKSPPTFNPTPLIPLAQHDWRAADPAKLRPFKPIYHITLSLRNVTTSDLITIDKLYHDRVQLRRNLIAERGATLHGVTPGGEGAAAVREMYAYLMGEHLPTRFPGLFTLSSDGSTVTNVITGKESATTLADGDEAATQGLATLGETVEEDLFFLVKTPDGHRCVAFVCCFASGFDPSSKLGKGLEAIHEPVPEYKRIGPSMERYFGRMEAGKPVSRLNWAVQTHNDLCNCKGNHITNEDELEEAIDAPVDMSQTNFRVEQQTLTRLPKTQALMFSFKTFLYPVADVRAEGDGPALADAIEGLQKGNASGMWTYKAAVRWGPPVCEFLRS